MLLYNDPKTSDIFRSRALSNFESSEFFLFFTRHLMLDISCSFLNIYLNRPTLSSKKTTDLVTLITVNNDTLIPLLLQRACERFCGIKGIFCVENLPCKLQCGTSYALTCVKLQSN